MKLLGHHHISMYTKDVTNNKYFYTEILGLRLVEISINQDNPSMYHFFYGDEEGSPGTLLSFFEIENAGKMHKGTNSIYRLSLLVESKEAVQYYKERLQQYGIKTSNVNFAGEAGIRFMDYDDLEIVMIPNNGKEIPGSWKKNSYTSIPEDYQILGMGPVEFKVRDAQKTTDFLINTLEFEYKNAQFTLNSNGLYSNIIVTESDAPVVRPGRGYIHHIAFNIVAADFDTLIERLNALEGNHTGIIDRYFFKSVYYRHNGIMYEFATPEPGFMRDTPKTQLGQQLNLPDFLEDDREAILSKLKPLD
ncbi:VOC family protein [Macrococcus armenti]|uniref:VOC family protein n=1 Tax=Macrococcus armenti TaxID=2875764 RepID=A0ABY3ZUL7_9STAP|nr:VOC family protein [Macrococcus armenti]UOB20601.1 VOC family protein [Macrococcus armenti]